MDFISADQKLLHAAVRMSDDRRRDPGFRKICQHFLTVLPEKAKQIAEAFLQKENSNTLRSKGFGTSSTPKLTLAYTSQKDKTPKYYVFNQEGGEN